MIKYSAFLGNAKNARWQIGKNFVGKPMNPLTYASKIKPGFVEQDFGHVGQKIR